MRLYRVEKAWKRSWPTPPPITFIATAKDSGGCFEEREKSSGHEGVQTDGEESSDERQHYGSLDSLTLVRFTLRRC